MVKYPSRIPGMSLNPWGCEYHINYHQIPYLTTTPDRTIAEMNQITPETAISYSFYSPSGPLGPTAAFEELQNAGCTLATEEWVYNHWGLILWKQAGMICLDPTEAKRWSWGETIAQLLYRCVCLGIAIVAFLTVQYPGTRESFKEGPDRRSSSSRRVTRPRHPQWSSAFPK